MITLQGRTALITGGSRGIGRATALLFARAGADVAFSYATREDAAAEVREEIERLGRRPLAVRADLSRPEEARSLVERSFREFPGLDILVNNHGIWTYGRMGDMSAEVWSETVRVNLDGVFYVTNAAVPKMISGRGGAIINVSSTAAIRGEADHSHYAATKGALNALTKSLAVELAPHGVRVNAVAPGWVDTDMSAEVFRDPEFKRRIRETIPLGRIPSPEDIAGPILFLASDLARHITGAVLNVNGGAVLCG
ncbi:MAG: SDR family oxidoreductase [Candidatus Aminicenantes bacterium]|nr:SDR family oxidoreductase [Candidatus Aminicenantes bacterium]